MMKYMYIITSDTCMHIYEGVFSLCDYYTFSQTYNNVDAAEVKRNIFVEQT